MMNGNGFMRATTPEQASADFWDWFGPKVDAWDAERTEQIASMPERDEATRTVLGAEALEIEFEPVTQADERALVLELAGVSESDATRLGL